VVDRDYLFRKVGRASAAQLLSALLMDEYAQPFFVSCWWDNGAAYSALSDKILLTITFCDGQTSAT
jgi:hypothetical protein